jgi:DNA-binding transcriptional LysR family regulator
MDISWEDARTFLAIAEGGSISAGALRMGLGQPTVSRRVAQIEARLGCALFTRGKQGVSLTEAGARLRPAAEQMARWATEFERLASSAEERPAGVVRVAAPPGIPVDLLAPLAARITEQHPEIRREVLASVDHVDLTRGGADLAIRTRPPNEPELMTLASGTSSIGVFASRDYVERKVEHMKARMGHTSGDPPPPFTLQDLDWVTWSPPYEHVPPRPMLERAISNFEPAFSSDSYLVLRSAVSAGLGAMILDRRGATAGARIGAAGELVEIPLEFTLPPNEFHLVCAKSMQFVPRVRAVAARLIEAVSEAETALDAKIA